MARKSVKRRSRKRWESIRAEVFGLLQGGAAVSAVAEEVGVTPETIRKWRKHWAALCTASLATSSLEGETVSALFRREAPAVARVILNQAKDGDARAAALVMKLIGGSLESEASEDGDPTAAAAQLERELDSLPASIAYEIVGLLEEAESPPTGAGARLGKRAAPGEVGSDTLPWTEEDPAPDQGGDAV